MLPTFFAGSFLSVALLLTPTSLMDAKAVVRYRYFDEFLIHLEKGEQAFIIGEEIEGSGEIEIGKNIESLVKRPMPIRSGEKHDKDVTCCMLGQLAGDKGYLCSARFYVARLISRNYNRAHSRKIESLRAGSPIKGSNDKLMSTFGQCVSRGTIFHKCCHQATLKDIPEKYDTNRKRAYDKTHTTKNQKQLPTKSSGY